LLLFTVDADAKRWKRGLDENGDYNSEEYDSEEEWAEEKQTSCKEVMEQFNQCTKTAHMNYVAAVNQGDDGRPDFHARKACNYAEQAIQGCGNLLPGACFTQEQVDEKKDAEIASILKSLESQIPNWDTSKCPAVTLSGPRPTPRPTWYEPRPTYEPTYRPKTTLSPKDRTVRLERYEGPMNSAIGSSPSSSSPFVILLLILIGDIFKNV